MKMAENTKQMYPNIQFFGVSCDKYEKVCDEYGIEGYPTLRFFKDSDGPTSKGMEQEFDDEEARDENTPGKIAVLVDVRSAENLETDHVAAESVKSGSQWFAELSMPIPVPCAWNS